MSSMRQEPRNIEQLLDRLCSAHVEEDKVSLGAIVDEIGSRSYGPLLLFAGLILASPLSGIPGMPTTMGVFILLLSGQLLFRKGRFWLPRWILRRAVQRQKLERAVGALRRPAGWIDKLLRPRMGALAGGYSEYVVAAVCAVIALGVPLMEIVPFSATTAGAAISLFGLSMLARDGLLALIGYLVTGGVAALVLLYLL